MASNPARNRRRTAARWQTLGATAVATAAAAAGLAAPGAAHAQSIVMAGSYQNFDVLNNTGEPTEGFEMEVHGVKSSDLTRIFPSNFNAGVIRYGFGSAVDIPGGVIVRWAATYSAATGTWSTATPLPPSLTTVPGDSCWTLGMPTTYDTAGCEHFGISTAYVNPTSISYYWLTPDPANPGTLVRNSHYVYLPAPVWTAVPPANPGLPPVVVAEVQAAPPQPALFGDAQWVRVYKTEQKAKVDLDGLVGDNHAVVPEQAAQMEVSWSLLQADPPGGNQRRRGKLANKGNAANGDHAVVRRYEYYRYAGAYDPITHEALCADLTCTAPSPGELGDAIGAQNAAANLDLNSLTVTLAGTGKGSVSSSDKVFACGSKCYGLYAPGATVTLTAKAASGSSFVTWGGACAGNASTCTVAVNAESTVGATFATAVGGGGKTFTLSVAHKNAGTVAGTPAGKNGAIDCGATCSVSFAQGSAVTLSAVPPAGKAFVNWLGACAGTLPSCTLVMNANLSAKAVFTP
jgi:hypothetical protein